MATADNKWKDLGITFKVVTIDDEEKVEDFLAQHFYPDEPTFRSCGIGFEKWVISAKHPIKPCLRGNTSVLALDKDGKIIGARLV